MRYELVTVTPEMAMEWLERNPHNRPLRSGQVRNFERLLRDGKAATTHQGVALDTNGNISDGQHRLTAIRNTGIPWKMWVAFDCDPDHFNKIDVGALRSISDRLHIHGHKNSKHVASVGKFAWNWHHGNAAFAVQPDDVQIHELVEMFPSLADVPRISIKGCGLSPALISFLCYIGPDQFAEEFQFAAEGYEERSDTGAARLAAKYRKWHADGKRPEMKKFIAWFILAANDFISGRQPRNVSYQDRNPFPEPLWTPPIPFGAVASDDED